MNSPSPAWLHRHTALWIPLAWWFIQLKFLGLLWLSTHELDHGWNPILFQLLLATVFVFLGRAITNRSGIADRWLLGAFLASVLIPWSNQYPFPQAGELAAAQAYFDSGLMRGGALAVGMLAVAWFSATWVFTRENPLEAEREGEWFRFPQLNLWRRLGLFLIVDGILFAMLHAAGLTAQAMMDPPPSLSWVGRLTQSFLASHLQTGFFLLFLQKYSNPIPAVDTSQEAPHEVEGPQPIS